MIQRVDYPPTFRFGVAVDSVSLAAFTEFQLPSLEVKTEEIKEGGLNNYVHQLPFRVEKGGTVTLKHGVTQGKALLRWYMQVMNGDIKNAMRQVTITTYSVALTPMTIWVLKGAYPIKWTGPTLKSDENVTSVESLEIAFQDFEVG